MPEFNLFGRQINGVGVKEVLRILTDLKVELILGCWFMLTYIPRALQDGSVLRAENTQLNLNKILFTKCV